MKKLLYITHLSGKRVNRIWLSSLTAAKELGFEVHLACNMDEAEHPGWDNDCQELEIHTHQIDFIRNPFNLKNKKAVKQLSELMKSINFEVVHCNTPVGGIIGRICAAKEKIPHIIYQAHGFHFWKGAPLKNWLLYYTAEKWMSRYTDTLVTITKDDYELAKKMKAKRVAYIHGIGIDFDLFSSRREEERNFSLREQLGIPKDSTVLLSVGELNSNKNHQMVFEALKIMNRNDIHYVICGEGELRKKYDQYLKKNKLSENIHLVGFQYHVEDYYRMADLFVFPSYREGIPTAIMEAIAIGVDVIASDTRGIRDIVPDGEYRFSPANKEELAKLIERVLKKDNMVNREKNRQCILNYSFSNVVGEMKEIYYVTRV